MSRKIIKHQVEEVLEITLSYPEKMNCIGFQMLDELDDTLVKASRDNSIRVLLLRGGGGRAFSSGADIGEFQALDRKEMKRWIERGQIVFNRLQRFPKPTVAYINGYALGGGLELALSCDFRVGSPSAILGFPEMEHGWLPGWGGILRLSRITGESKAMEMITLSERMTAEQAYQLGILSKIEKKDGEHLQLLLKKLSKIDAVQFELLKAKMMGNRILTSDADMKFDYLSLLAAMDDK